VLVGCQAAAQRCQAGLVLFCDCLLSRDCQAGMAEHWMRLCKQSSGNSPVVALPLCAHAKGQFAGEPHPPTQPAQEGQLVMYHVAWLLLPCRSWLMQKVLQQ
jgi:hypothetical protein